MRKNGVTTDEWKEGCIKKTDKITEIVMIEIPY